jgi:hypothetical protein
MLFLHIAALLLYRMSSDVKMPIVVMFVIHCILSIKVSLTYSLTTWYALNPSLPR